MEFMYEYARNFPVLIPSLQFQQEMTKFVDKILELNKELQKINPESDKGIKLQEEINRIDKQIDQKVYELYGLTEEEIRIVEESV